MADLEAAFNSLDQAAPGHYSASQTALLLMDFHSLFVQKLGGPAAASALQVAVELRKWAKSQGIAVIHAVLDTNAKPYTTCKGSARFISIIDALKGDAGNEPAELLDNGDGKEVTFLRAPGYVSALRSPGLEDYLKENGIKSLIMTGLSTGGCVMRTAFPATDAEYVVTVIKDACADPKPGVHDTIVNDILPSKVHVVTGAEFREGYAKAQNGN